MKTNSRRNWVNFAVSAGFVGLAAALVFWAFPHLRDAVGLALYTIPSHMFVSPFNHEWLLLLVAKSNPALWCALASLAGCLIAGMWDYWLFIPLIHHPRIRPKYSRTGLYQKSVALFRKWPFWALVIIGLTPVPFYPIKFLAIADNYPLKKYLLALIVGRTPRYYALAYVGQELRLPTWSLLALALAILVFGIAQYRKGDKDLTLSEIEEGIASEAGDTATAPSTSPTIAAQSTSSGKSL
ncbi:MAG: VTT domain-containing protein [Candidatus Latescibacterota bacterium]|nr:MAG: VTT domain-containing protein [Candidatus Latescibacterota bacterium]